MSRTYRDQCPHCGQITDNHVIDRYLAMRDPEEIGVGTTVQCNNCKGMHAYKVPLNH